MIDFTGIAVGEKIMLPEGKWNDAQRAVMAQAAAFADKQEPRWQFQATGHEGSTFEKGQYWIERTR